MTRLFQDEDYEVVRPPPPPPPPPLRPPPPAPPRIPQQPHVSPAVNQQGNVAGNRQSHLQPAQRVNRPTDPRNNPTVANNNRNEEEENEEHAHDISWTDATTQTVDSKWFLRISLAKQRTEFLVTPDLTSETLALCLQQAYENMVGPTAPIIGLFVEPRGPFVTLTQLLNDHTLHKHSYCFQLRPVPPPQPKPRPWYMQSTVMSRLFLVVLCASLYVQWMLKGFPNYFATSMEFDELIYYYTITVHNLVVEGPLQEFYRFGPSWLGGWEGEAMARICSRVTYHGDAEFWTRNYDECQRIYRAKEQSFLRIATPLMDLLIFIVWILLLRYIVATLYRMYLQNLLAQQRMRQGPPADMVETYRAFQIIMRQIRLSMSDQK